MARKMVPIDGNEATTHVAHALNEVLAIYPITPSSNMGEYADAKSAKGDTNLWGTVPVVVEMQSEAGAAGAVHGALQGGALSTTFTASQGLLLMIPNMFKIAGELTPTCFHVSARTIAAHALSIFGDHSDVMAVRQTGFAMLASNSVQENMDLALIGYASSLQSRIPFLHFFDGFRTSHEVQKIEALDFDDMRALIDDSLVTAHRLRGMSPDHPILRGTAQNPDVFFQSRETINPLYAACPDIVQKAMDRFADRVGRKYRLFEYVGHPEADRMVILMGSGAETAEETVNWMVARGEKVGALKIRLFRPFSVQHFVAAIPKSVHRIAVLDRTKEPGAVGEPLYEDVRTAFGEAMQADKTLFGGRWPVVVGGRYGLSSKEFTPTMVKAVFDNLATDAPKNHFTVGIHDDVGHTSLDYDRDFSIEPDDVVRCMFYGLGADGTVSANKNSIKIIADHTPNYAQGYFVYDSKKAGAITVSHLRFGPRPIQSPYLIEKANFVACHQWSFLERYDMLSHAATGSTFLLNSIYDADTVWDQIPRPVQQQIIDKKMKFFVIDAYKVGDKLGLGPRINTIMQTCFFALSGVLPKDEAIGYIKGAIKKTYAAKGDKVLEQNYGAVDNALANLHEVKVPATATSAIEIPPIVPAEAPEFVQYVTAEIMAGRGDDIPVSRLPIDGTYPTATTKWEKRNIALEIPVWEPDPCTQCGKCSLVCPHAAIRMKLYEPKDLEGAPVGFKSAKGKGKIVEHLMATVQVFPEDCTGCGACVFACPAKDKVNPERKAINMAPQPPLRMVERDNAKFFLNIPETPLGLFRIETIKGSQLRRPLFEFSGACANCGETPYIKLVTQLFGDRMLVGNATGCSSIYGGNLPTTPYAQNAQGRGPTWNNSLFEDNAEFGLGMALAVQKFNQMAIEMLTAGIPCLSDQTELVQAILTAVQTDQAQIEEQRVRVARLKEALSRCQDEPCRRLLGLADYLVKKSVWIVGGDGWAYDIGYGGLDHVLASGRNVNILVLDTEVYSNTGGQASKSTPRGAVARFAEAGKQQAKKDLALMAMIYGNVYVARVAMGANDAQTVKAIVEAESYDGPSIILAYSHCIAHGISMGPGSGRGAEAQKRAVESGHWILCRYDPRRATEGKNPLQLDSKLPTQTYEDWAKTETRFSSLMKKDPEAARRLIDLGTRDTVTQWRLYEQLAGLKCANESEAPTT